MLYMKTYLHFYLCIFLRVRNAVDKSCWDSQNTHFIFN